MTSTVAGFIETASIGLIAVLAPAGVAVVHVLGDAQDHAEPDSFGRYALATLLVTLVTVPLIRWVIGRLDRHLVAQDKHNIKMAKLITLLIAEYKQKRLEDTKHHKDAMDTLAEIEKILEEDEVEATKPGEGDGA